MPKEEVVAKLSKEDKKLIEQLVFATALTQKEMELVVIKYIYVRKGVIIEINDMRAQYAGMPAQFQEQLIASKDLPMLFHLYNVACMWFGRNIEYCI